MDTMMQILEKKKLKKKSEQELIELQQEVRNCISARKSRINEGDSTTADYSIYRQYTLYLDDINDALYMCECIKPKKADKHNRKAGRDSKRNY